MPKLSLSAHTFFTTFFNQPDALKNITGSLVFNVPILLTKFQIESAEVMKNVQISTSSSSSIGQSYGSLSLRRVSILME